MPDEFDEELIYADAIKHSCDSDRNPGKPDKKFYRHRRLLPNGDSQPDCFLRNREEFGYSCPRLEFVESPEEPSMRLLSKKWLTSQGLMRIWHEQQKWNAARRRAWVWKDQEKFGVSAETINRMREEEMVAQRSIMITMRQTLLDTIRLGIVREMSSIGKIMERPIGPKDLKDAISSLDILNKGIERTLGMNDAMLKIAAGDTGDGEIETVRKIIYNVTVNTDSKPEEFLPERALPQGSVVEGAVFMDRDEPFFDDNGEVVVEPGEVVVEVSPF